MGCTSSSTSSKMYTVTKVKGKVGDGTFGRRTDLNPDDFIIRNMTDINSCTSSLTTSNAIITDNMVIKSNIEGQQMILENCHQTIILLLDHIASLTCDNMTSCTIITGPVESSVFLRNCIDCTFIIVCQQLRLRECDNCSVSLFSTTNPIIELSSRIVFSCYQFNYFNLSKNLDSCSLNIWNNEWHNVYDFTPDGTNAALNYSYLVKKDSHKLLEKVNINHEKVDMLADLLTSNGLCDLREYINSSYINMHSIIPMTIGISSLADYNQANVALICVSQHHENYLQMWLTKWISSQHTSNSGSDCNNSKSNQILRTCMHCFDMSQKSILFDSSVIKNSYNFDENTQVIVVQITFTSLNDIDQAIMHHCTNDTAVKRGQMVFDKWIKFKI